MASLPVYSQRFVGGSFTPGDVAVGPVPATEVWILRDLDLYCSSPLSVPFTHVFLEGQDGQAIFYYQWLPETQAWASWRGRQVIESGETFVVKIIGSPVDVTLSGYVLAAP